MNASTLVAVGLSLISAVAYALAAVAQERLAAGAGTKTGLMGLLRRSAWWWSVGLNATGACCMSPPSPTVRSPWSSRWVRSPSSRPYRWEPAGPAGRSAGASGSGTAFTLVGLAVILLAAAGTAPDDTLTLTQALGVSGVGVALVAMLTRPGAPAGSAARGGLRASPPEWLPPSLRR